MGVVLENGTQREGLGWLIFRGRGLSWGVSLERACLSPRGHAPHSGCSPAEGAEAAAQIGNRWRGRAHDRPRIRGGERRGQRLGAWPPATRTDAQAWGAGPGADIQSDRERSRAGGGSRPQTPNAERGVWPGCRGGVRQTRDPVRRAGRGWNRGWAQALDSQSERRGVVGSQSGPRCCPAQV